MGELRFQPDILSQKIKHTEKENQSLTSTHSWARMSSHRDTHKHTCTHTIDQMPLSKLKGKFDKSGIQKSYKNPFLACGEREAICKALNEASKETQVLWGLFCPYSEGKRNKCCEWISAQAGETTTQSSGDPAMCWEAKHEQGTPELCHECVTYMLGYVGFSRGCSCHPQNRRHGVQEERKKGQSAWHPWPQKLEMILMLLK